MNINFAIKDCIDVGLFDENGKKILNIDFLNSAKIVETTYWDEDQEIENDAVLLLLNHEVTNFELLELQSGNMKQKTDFDKEMGNFKITFNKKRNNNVYKLIGKLRIKLEDGKDELVKIVCNKIKFSDVKYRENKIFEFSAEEISQFDTAFRLYEDENGDFLSIIRN